LDGDILLQNYYEHGCNGKDCKMHQGFMNGYNNLLKSGLYRTVKGLLNKHRDAKLLITGFSLGAALAAIGSYDISQKFKEEGINIPSMVVYTFGEPRIGNKILAETINGELDIFRVVVEKDPVANLPPRKIALSFGGFYHPGI